MNIVHNIVDFLYSVPGDVSHLTPNAAGLMYLAGTVAVIRWFLK